MTRAEYYKHQSWRRWLKTVNRLRYLGVFARDNSLFIPATKDVLPDKFERQVPNA